MSLAFSKDEQTTMDSLKPCRVCGNTPEETVLHIGTPHVAYGCCEMKTQSYASRRKAKQVWNRWQESSEWGPPDRFPYNPADVDNPNVGYDIDGVLANFIKAMMDKARELGYRDDIPDHWMQWDQYRPTDSEAYQEAWASIEWNHTWWLTAIEPFDDAKIFTDVRAYITARSVPSQLSERWLFKHDFPRADVHSVGHGNPKAGIADKTDLDLFVDDKPSTVKALNLGGIPCLLMDRPHNWTATELDDVRIRCLSQVLDYL